MNRQRLSGFSLMEMMVVLLIVSVVAAASAPMVNRKMVADAVGGCKWRENGNTIFYNGEGGARTVAIGTNDAGASNPRLHIATDNNHPHIRLTNGVSAANIHYRNTSTLFTTDNPTVSGSVIIGPGANSLDDNAVAIGVDSNIADGAIASIAIGAAADVRNSNNAIVNNYRSIAMGGGATVDGSHSVAIGGDTRAVGTYDGAVTFGPGDGATSVGWGSWAVGNNATAIGRSASTYGVPDVSATNAVAIGFSARATSPDSIAIGDANVDTTAENSIAIGRVASSSAKNSISIGSGSSTTAANSIAIGAATASATGATAFGSGATASAETSIAIGAGSTTNSANSLTIGGATINSTTATNSIAIGSTSATATANSVAIGRQAATWSDTQTAYTDSIAIGNNTWTRGNCTIALGTSASAYGDEFSDGSVRSIAIGTAAKAHATGTIAIGGSAKASGVSSIAIGAPHDYDTTKSVVKYEYDYYNTKPQGSYVGWKTARCEDYGINPELQQMNPDKPLVLPGMDTGADTSAQAGTKPPATCSITYYKEKMVYDTKQDTEDKDAWLQKVLNYKAYETWDGDPSMNSGEWKVDMDPTKPAVGVLCDEREITVQEPTVKTGYETQATGSNSVAIGPGAVASNDNSVAIGKDATTTTTNQIVLGDASTTVYIPGNLVVAQSVAANQGFFNYYLINGRQDGSLGRDTNDNKWRPFKVENADTNSKRDSDELKKELAPALWVNYGFSISSDRRLKNVGEVFKAGLEEIKKLELFHYTYKKDESKTPHVGVMAQDLMKIFPDAVWKGEDGFYRIRMEDMFYALVNAVKELDAKIESLKSNEIAELRKRVDDLEKVNAKLAKQNEKIVEQNEKLEKRINALERKVK